MEPSWERHCADIAIEHVNKATGRDIWAEIGGKPGSHREAVELYKRNGARTLAGMVTKVLGPKVDVKLARRGDICMVDGALGICRGELVECFDRMQPLGRVTAAWRIEGRG